ncbi:hypothetical protein A2738_00205 [Candidatus Nomurabacteria bacterium RIFCSPHIGHO2_01_FULL_42_15]|uniref:Uncharacterized protein n=1 Tax=Candidatus Nomurabacteria bacterium RIFCSPHIGHO2_01_FULL_42_15 TaxID=1801742 RepID=A0A1F6VGM4_9BACT|nr:MAG: hypothetical protein A2738_00205 [Candidatus Nomurabacteria bacterium RIFCSPHIGHO2_01_FULL_42_15]
MRDRPDLRVKFLSRYAPKNFLLTGAVHLFDFLFRILVKIQKRSCEVIYITSHPGLASAKG